MLKSIYQLTQGRVIVAPQKIQSIEDAVLCLASENAEKRIEAIKYLRRENERGHILWNSLSPYFVFYYYTLVVKRDIESSEEFKTLLSNSIQNTQSSLLDKELFNILSWFHSIIQLGLNEDTFRNIQLPISEYKEPLSNLVIRLIYTQLGGVTDLNSAIALVRQDLVPINIEENVSEAYLVSETNNIIQAIENYFLLMAETTLGRVSGLSFLLKRKTEIKKSIDQQTKKIIENRYLQVIFTVVFAFILIVSGVSQIPGISSPLNGVLGLLAICLSLLIFVMSLPIGPLPRWMLKFIAYILTINKRIAIYVINKELRKMMISYKP
jgi:uncharacterized Tic20 family protein